MNYLIFSLVFLYISNHIQINKFIYEFGKTKRIGKKIKDQGLIKLVKEKTGLKLDYILIFDSNKPFGMMPGFPPLKPNMILSKKLYQQFDKDELEWVTIHEAGHYILYHTVKFAIALLLLLILGVYLIFIFNITSIILAIILGILLSLIFVRIARIFEKEIDNFAAKRISNPQGMITATEKLTKAYATNKLLKLKRDLLGWNVLPSKRIAIAEKEIKKRQ